MAAGDARFGQGQGELMEKAIVLSLVASLCTATTSVCQRIGARMDEAEHFDLRLVRARDVLSLAGLPSDGLLAGNAAAGWAGEARQADDLAIYQCPELGKAVHQRMPTAGPERQDVAGLIEVVGLAVRGSPVERALEAAGVCVQLHDPGHGAVHEPVLVWDHLGGDDGPAVRGNQGARNVAVGLGAR